MSVLPTAASNPDPPYPPSRQPTLESQQGSRRERSIWERLIGSMFVDEDISDDVVEKHLEDTIRWSDADFVSFTRSLRQLRRDYSRFKARPGCKIIGELFRSKTFSDPSLPCERQDLAEHAGGPGSGDDLKIEASDSLSQCATKIFKALNKRVEGSLRLVVLATEANVGTVYEFLPFRSKLMATFARRLASLVLAPSQVIAACLFRQWHLPVQMFRRLHLYVFEFDVELKPRIILPSEKLVEGNLDPSTQVHNRISLTWQSKAPMFVSDLQINIWQFHKELPSTCFADVFLIPPKASTTGEWRQFICFQSPISLLRFWNQRNDGSVYASITRPDGQGCWSVTSEVLFSILAVFQVMVQETQLFAQGCLDEIQNMRLKGRQNPTADKIRYLLHLDDCRASASNGIAHALRVLPQVKIWLQPWQSSGTLWDGGQPLDRRFDSLETDLGFLQLQLSQNEEEILALQQKIREQMFLTQERRNFILTIVAAVYLPLSFVTSFLGMNMNTTTSAGPEGFSNYTIALLKALPPDVGNSTKALVSAIGTSGSRTWDWKTFAILLGGLLITLPLSLAIESILRWSYRSAVYYVAYWRALAVVAGVVLVIISVLGPVRYWDVEFIYDPDRSNRTIFRYDLPIMLLSFGVNGVLILIQTWRVAIAWKQKRRFGFWIGLLILSLFAWLMGYFGPFLVGGLHVPWTIIPWMWFTWRWLRPWWKRRRAGKRT